MLNWLVGGILSHTSRSSWIMTSNRRPSDIQEHNESGRDEDGSSARMFLLVVVGIMWQRTISEVTLIAVTLGRTPQRVAMCGVCVSPFLEKYPQIIPCLEGAEVARFDFDIRLESCRGGNM